MLAKLTYFFLFIFLILLQSCSGGRVGNFLELSFKNIDQKNLLVDEKDNKEDKNEMNLKNNLSISSSKIITKNDQLKLKNIESNSVKNIIETKLSDNKKSIQLNKNSSKNSSIKKKENNDVVGYQPQSYKIVVILKKVDPTAPAENFSNALRDANLSFEIEKIERFSEKNSIEKKNKFSF